jgi:TRAP-type C4-dicarboxylate transport system permease small subunit
VSLRRSERNPVARAIEPALRVIVYAAGWWLLVIVALTCVEILGRKLFAFSLQGIDEVGGYTLGVTASLAFAYALVKRGHTRVDFVLAKLPRGVQAVLNVAAMAVLAAIVTYGAIRGWTVLAESLEFKSRATTPLRTPLWMPQSGWLAGWAIFALTSIVLAVHAVVLLFGDRDRLNRYYGPLSIDEEIEAELDDEAAQRAARASEGSGRA